MSQLKSFGWFKQLAVSFLLGLVFTLYILFLSIDNVGTEISFFQTSLTWLSAFLLLVGLNYLWFRLNYKFNRAPYALWFLVLALGGRVFVQDLTNDFRFIEPKVDKNSVLPETDPSSWRNVKLILNGDCRRAKLLNQATVMQAKIRVPDNAYLVFSFGVVHQGAMRRGLEIEVSASLAGVRGPSTEIGRWKLAAKEYRWFDQVLDLSSWAGEEPVLTFRNHTPIPEKDKEKAFLFITSPRIVVQDAARPLPNLILVVVDSLRYDAVTHKRGQGYTPNMYERLQAGGVDFHRHYAQSSWTCPSVASLFTSKMPIQTGAVSKQQFYLNGPNSTFMELGRERGYLTAGFTSNGAIHGRFNYDQGMDSLKMLNTKASNWWVSSEFLNKDILAWLETYSHLPFIIYAHYMDPHIPYWPPPRYFVGAAWEYGLIKTVKNLPLILTMRVRGCINWPAESTGALKALYHAEIRYWDKSFDEFINRFEEMEGSSRTMIIIVSDHGEEFYDHGGFVHGSSLYQELIHVPMIIFPAGSESFNEVTAITQNLDLMPSILEHLEIPIPQAVLGRSLLPDINSKAQQSVRPGIAYSELPVNSAYGKSRHKKFPRYIRACVQGQKKVIENGPNQELLSRREFYRLDNDPQEKSPLSSTESEEARELVNTLGSYFDTLPGKINIPPPGKSYSDPEAVKALRALGYVE
jgi:arylsulfatase A-like enzyme